MSIFSKIKHGIGVAVQGTSDTFANGPMGPALREELIHAHGEEKNLLATYSQINGDITAWTVPLDDCGRLTSALLQQTSDYVHGIAVNYQQIINDNSLDTEDIGKLANGNIIQPLLNLPIPGTIAGIPTALIPGVEGVKMIEGIVNMSYDSLTLNSQLAKARNDIDKIRSYIARLQGIERDLTDLKTYILTIANNVLDVYRRTTGLESLPNFAADTPDDLNGVAQAMEKAIAQITNVKGNAFTVCRFIMNLVSQKKIKTASDQQIKYIANKLNTVDDIRAAFESEANIEVFVRNFFTAQLLTPAILLDLPAEPDNITPYLSETPPAHDEFTSINSSDYDPPDIDISDFPTAG
ncbi:MAG TPA: hypothetical protein VF131_17030 [Blastocatellia bacterium]|nr:hypothetical protein [Blastocatellia bacterium]